MIRAAACAFMILITPLAASAQTDSRFRSNGQFFSASVLYQANALSEFSPNICPGDEFIGELSGGILPLKWLGASVFGRVHGEIRAESCVNGLFPPPPDSGTVAYTDYSAVEGYPYISTGLRITAFTGGPRGGALRAYGGGEWLWGKSFFAPLFGFGFSIPANPFLLVAEAEHRLLPIPLEQVEVTYRGHRPISEDRTTYRSKTARWAFRVGVELVMPSR